MNTISVSTAIYFMTSVSNLLCSPFELLSKFPGFTKFYLFDFSLLKVHLQLRGFTVFLDIEKLRAGKFDDNLLNSVRNARHFILVLTPCCLDRCMGDTDMKDWVHRVRIGFLPNQAAWSGSTVHNISTL